ncbi:isopentenyl-diphosphate delta-isomerase [Rhodovulum iodosum]|uniref:Isopentenyl-diphosphate Delta-isomerase n=1 Tax=Rhodovulum iodosum TaxID=68291 RepID=A0ABV3XQQ4_9RHOB|nr:isopentenyl-diphosphate Delta-isomerase [Rhodovulum robiginosum]RSK32922.1 isopentenyl-diphosphate Delta-isomerase [Rhodovulum robiginosum]
MNDMIPAWVNGELEPVEKLEVHQKGLRHKAISVFVMDGDKVLIQRRALGKYHTPGYWANTCCTHPHWEESAEACARRRLEEELGITGLTLNHRDRVEYRADVGGGLIEHEVVDIFIAAAGADLNIAPNPDEVMDVKWIALDELAREVERAPDSYTPWLRIYLKEHRERIFEPG